MKFAHKNNLEEMITEIYKTVSNNKEKIKTSLKNWAIDTSGKASVYVPAMGLMEAYNGLECEQIAASRLTSLAIDTVVARAYTGLADKLYEKFAVDSKKGGVKAWAIDTGSMISTYAPVYAGILYALGADTETIVNASYMAAGIATLTSRPFRKYVLSPWREYCGFKAKK